MSVLKRLGAVAALCGAAMFFTGSAAFAGFWDWSTPYRGPSRDISTLMITSNYTKSRMLADLIQNETKQPYILLPAVGQEDRIFFCPARGKEAKEINEAELARFIKFVNPKQIIVLGDRAYVPSKYIRMIDPKQTVYTISNKNWNEAAESLASLLDLHNLSSDYKRLSYQMESGKLYRSTAFDGAETIATPSGAEPPGAAGADFTQPGGGFDTVAIKDTTEVKAVETPDGKEKITVKEKESVTITPETKEGQKYPTEFPAIDTTPIAPPAKPKAAAPKK
jgi:hypothetical protein